MFAFYRDGELWEEVFESIEEAMEYVEKTCSDWREEDLENCMVVEIVPRVVPSMKIHWKKAV